MSQKKLTFVLPRHDLSERRIILFPPRVKRCQYTIEQILDL